MWGCIKANIFSNVLPLGALKRLYGDSMIVSVFCVFVLVLRFFRCKIFYILAEELKEAIEFNRQEAIIFAREDYTEELVTV